MKFSYSDYYERKDWVIDPVLVAIDMAKGYKLYWCETDENDNEDDWFIVAKSERSARQAWKRFADSEEIPANQITAFPIAILKDKDVKIYKERGGFAADLPIIKKAGVTVLSENAPRTFIFNGITFTEGDIDALVDDAREHVGKVMEFKRGLNKKGFDLN